MTVGTQQHPGHVPLAARMRPAALDELLGQEHLTRAGGPVRSLIEASTPPSAILWGPPGSGKTTIATLLASHPGRRVVHLSALTSTVKDLRAEIEEARRRRAAYEVHTVLFVDEVHRFTRTQQDALLGAVENRDVTLLAATTENPGVSVASALLSRCLLIELRPLDDDALRRVVERAVASPEGLGGSVTVAPDAVDHLVRLADGDARRALTLLEAAAAAAGPAAAGATVGLAHVEVAADRAAPRYDRDGDRHYDVVSAFIKSIRGSDADAALHWLARMIEGGEDPRFIARRLIISASEDIGLADPTALPTAVAAAQAVALIGMPEGRIPLAQAVVHLALAPKSNAVIVAVDRALGDVRAGHAGPVPSHLRDSHNAAGRRLGHGRGYRYPHDAPAGVVAQQYVPDAVANREYYVPAGRGAERDLLGRLQRLRRLVRGGRG